MVYQYHMYAQISLRLALRPAVFELYAILRQVHRITPINFYIFFRMESKENHKSHEKIADSVQTNSKGLYITLNLMIFHQDVDIKQTHKDDIPVFKIRKQRKQ